MKPGAFFRVSTGALLFAAAFAAGGCRPPAPSIGIETAIPSLKDVCAPYFEIGAALEPYQLSSRPHDELLGKHFNSIVAENAMKPASIHPREDYFNWSEADKIVNYAKAHGMKLRFHTLGWHNQVPDWFFAGNDKNLLLQRLENHIRKIIERYGDKIDYWDVVNEVIDPEQPDGMRRSKWYLISGKEYIKTAFRVADDELKKHGWRDGAKLYINDYNTHETKKRDFIWSLIEELRKEGIPVDGVGHQTHIDIRWPEVSQIVDSIGFFAGKGLDNQITELDMSIYTDHTISYKSYQEIPWHLLIRQGYRYKELFDGLRSVAGSISNVTFWGLADDHTWLGSWPFPRPDAPLLSGKLGRAAEDATLTDKFNPFQLALQAQNLKADTWNNDDPEWDTLEGDNWRVIRNAGDQPGVLLYEWAGLTGFTVNIFRNGYQSPPPVVFSVSDDGSSWTEVTGLTPQVSENLGGYWYYYTYTATDLNGNFLKIEITTADGQNTYKTRIATVTIQGMKTLTDKFNPFQLALQAQNLKADTWNNDDPEWDTLEGDNWRATRNAGDQPGVLVYEWAGLTGFTVNIFRNGYQSPPPVVFSVSDDGSSWTEVTGLTPQVSENLGGYWYYYTYTATGLNGNFLKIEITTADGGDTSKTRIATAILNALESPPPSPSPSTSPSPSPSPPPEEIVDELHNFDTAFAYQELQTTTWNADTNNSDPNSAWVQQIEGDTHRAERKTDDKPGFLVYQWNWEEATDFKVETFRNSTPLPEITFSVSVNGEDWTDVTAQVQTASKEVPPSGGFWFYDTYQISNLENTYKYLKIEIGTNRPIWALKIAKVLIWPHEEVTPSPTASPSPPPSGGCAPGGGGGGGCRPSGMS